MLSTETSDRYRVTPGRTSAQSTVRAIGRNIQAGTSDPMVRAWALRVLKARGTDGRDDRAIVAALLEWVQRSLPYRHDLHAIELLQSPRALLRGIEVGAPGGDCDDFDILLGSMLQSVGVAVRIVTASYDGKTWGHTFLEAYIRGAGWTAIDAANATAGIGWEQSGAEARRVYDLSGRVVADRNGAPAGLSGPSRRRAPDARRGPDFFLEGR